MLARVPDHPGCISRWCSERDRRIGPLPPTTKMPRADISATNVAHSKKIAKRTQSCVCTMRLEIGNEVIFGLRDKDCPLLHDESVATGAVLRHPTSSAAQKRRYRFLTGAARITGTVLRWAMPTLHLYAPSPMRDNVLAGGRAIIGAEMGRSGVSGTIRARKTGWELTEWAGQCLNLWEL